MYVNVQKKKTRRNICLTNCINLILSYFAYNNVLVWAIGTQRNPKRDADVTWFFNCKIKITCYMFHSSHICTLHSFLPNSSKKKICANYAMFRYATNNKKHDFVPLYATYKDEIIRLSKDMSTYNKRYSTNIDTFLKWRSLFVIMCKRKTFKSSL